MFYNTGIATYVWVLTNKKSEERQGKVQLIDAGEMYGSMRKSLGSKRKIMSEDHIEQITRCFGNFEEMELLLDSPANVATSSRGRKSATAKKEKPKMVDMEGHMLNRILLSNLPHGYLLNTSSISIKILKILLNR